MPTLASFAIEAEKDSEWWVAFAQIRRRKYQDPSVDVVDSELRRGHQMKGRMGDDQKELVQTQLVAEQQLRHHEDE
ncbi:hypothetical protein E4U32_008286 [Claviceps aff. humidiphila group G2b]|nr:hypothetical protein E4U32_008286 [Claviceps aff. humidiphila group G2b]